VQEKAYVRVYRNNNIVSATAKALMLDLFAVAIYDDGSVSIAGPNSCRNNMPTEVCRTWIDVGNAKEVYIVAKAFAYDDYLVARIHTDRQILEMTGFEVYVRSRNGYRESAITAYIDSEPVQMTGTVYTGLGVNRLSGDSSFTTVSGVLAGEVSSSSGGTSLDVALVSKTWDRFLDRFPGATIVVLDLTGSNASVLDVLSGKATVECNGETYEYGQLDVLFIPKECGKVSISGRGNLIFDVYVMRSRASDYYLCDVQLGTSCTMPWIRKRGTDMMTMVGLIVVVVLLAALGIALAIALELPKRKRTAPRLATPSVGRPKIEVIG